MGLWKVAGWAGVLAMGCGVLHAVGGDDPVIVEKIVDGDTIDVALDGETTRIRFLNVNTPEIGHDGQPSECLAEEAKRRVEELIPVGSEVTLEFDEDRLDKYGRTLAGVFRDGNLINAEIAREGLGVAMDVAPNHRFYSQVYAAQLEAGRAGHGIFAAGPECFVAPQQKETIQEAQAAVLAATSFAPNLVDLSDDASLVEARTLLVRLTDAKWALDKIGDARDDQSEFQQAAYSKQTTQAVTALKNDVANIVEDFEKAVKEEDRRRGEAARSAEKQRAAEARREESNDRTAQSNAIGPLGSETGEPASVPQPAPPSAPKAAPTYTGCRAYGGKYALDSVDEKGRPYAKIDCILAP